MFLSSLILFLGCLQSCLCCFRVGASVFLAFSKSTVSHMTSAPPFSHVGSLSLPFGCLPHVCPFLAAVSDTPGLFHVQQFLPSLILVMT